MIRIWKQGGTMERVGVVAMAASLASCFFDIVDFASLPRTLDRLAVAMPIMAIAWVLVLGGQQLRHRREDRNHRRD